MVIKIEQEIIDEVCKELCFYDIDGPKCNSNCKRCNNIYWRHFRTKVKRCLQAYENIKRGQI